ncbi:30S ribosomal protein S18 [Patescibacteria group bacterium]|nr:30S ribosomal protein S18 [Patescibacteria group bacterium]MBU4512190.1 30S ribosomal protein S18 [Patescibacteria group bacterium]MCG2693460.1 30S ribosomal protein S18 [Candidatus Parcubacteria bacterium]
MPRKTNTIIKEKPCYFCINGIKEIDYQNIQILQKFISSYNKIVPKRRSGLCAKHQRKIAAAIKRARIMGLIPFISR